jgi:hypothetical protein
MKWIATRAKVESRIQNSHGYTVFCAFIMVTFVSILVYKIYTQEQMMDRFKSVGREQGWLNTTKTPWRGIQYIGAYFLAYFSSYITLGYKATGNLDIPHVFDFLFSISLPLLVFINSLVYFQPIYLAYKGSNPDKVGLFA